MRRFDRFVPQGPLVERYGTETAAAVRQEMREEYQRLLPHVPCIGKGGSPDSGGLDYGPMALAVYRVVLRHGGDLEDAGELLHECGRALWQRVPGVARPVLRWYVFNGLRRRRMQKAARNSQARRYPADWVFEMVEGDGATFDFGRDITECGLVKYLHVQGADELTPYLCDWDYIMAETLGFQLRRTKTLAWGCDRCDFRMTKDGTTSAPWPPLFVERSCGRTHSTSQDAPTAS
jgi:hypothetical protein